MNTVLLDAGGVILNEVEYEQKGAEVIVKILEKYFTNYSEKQYWIDTEESAISLCPHTRKYIFWKYAKNDFAVYEKISDEYKKAWKTANIKMKLMDGIDVEIKKLHKCFGIILAGQYGKEVLDVLDNYQLKECFRSLLSQDDFDITKPDPRYYKQICIRAGVDPNKCIMVGDRIDKDVIPAKANGMKTVFIRSGIYKNQKGRIPEEYPDLVLESVNGMAEKIIGKWYYQ
jgi:HAD superfamily hydrolase (TIGR01549 family)